MCPYRSGDAVARGWGTRHFELINRALKREWLKIEAKYKNLFVIVFGLICICSTNFFGHATVSANNNNGDYDVDIVGDELDENYIEKNIPEPVQHDEETIQDGIIEEINDLGVNLFELKQPRTFKAESELLLMSSNDNLFCSIFPFWCDLGEPKYCANSPDLPGCGFSGGGGSGGGGGAGRSWGDGKTFDENWNEVQEEQKRYSRNCHVTNMETWETIYGEECSKHIPYVKSVAGYYVKTDYVPIDWVNIGVIDPRNGNVIGPALTTTGKCWQWDPRDRDQLIISECFTDYVPGLFFPGAIGKKYKFDSNYKLLDPNTDLPYEDDEYTGGYPNTYIPEEPPVDGECNACAKMDRLLGKFDSLDAKLTMELTNMDTKITFLQETLENLNNLFDDTALLRKLDSIIEKMPGVGKLNEIIAAITNLELTVDFEQMVDKTGTNFWDFLSSLFDNLFRLVEYLVEKIIYLVVPENPDFVWTAVNEVTDAFQQKFEPVEEIKVFIQSSVIQEEKQFQDYHLNLPVYGEVMVFHTEFLTQAVPRFRAILSGVMLILTLGWAYRKISSDLIK